MKVPQLRIHLLGPIEILNHGQNLLINRRMERAILYYLAGEHQPVSRSTLIDIFWPDAGNVDTRRALRTSLSRLRNELPNAKILVTELDQVSLDHTSCWVDLAEFEEHYRSLRNILMVQQPKRALPAQIVNQMQGALALWRGDSLIEGDNLSSYPEMETWLRELNQKLGEQRKFLMRKLGEHYRLVGRPELALEIYQKLGKLDLLDVRLHLTTLEILTDLKRHQAVVAYCDSLEMALEREYNVPLPEDILSRYQYSQIQVQTKPSDHTPEWPITLSMHLPLIGRQAELEQLQRAFSQGGLAVVKGELGSGKTRLIQELFCTLSPNPHLLLAPSIEMENKLPYSAIIHCLRHHIPKVIWQSIDVVWANQIKLLLPEITELRSDLEQPRFAKLLTEQQNLFQAILHLFQNVAENYGRVLFFLDDAQWLDHQTIQVLMYMIMHGFFEKHGLLILAARTEETNRNLEALINGAYRSYPVSQVVLYGLCPNDLSDLVHEVLNTQPPAGLIEQLYRETNGNPFFALEIIRNILESSTSINNLTSGLPLPESVHALIRNRLNHLTEEDRHILLTAAVIGFTFQLDLLCSIAGLDPIMNVATIEPLIKTGFLHSTSIPDYKENVLQFVHELMRDVILKECSPIRVQMIHLKVAESMSQEPKALSNAAVIANHFLEAGSIQNAFLWYLKAAEHAWTLSAKEDVLHAFEQAENLYQNAAEGTFNLDDLLNFYSQWGEFAYQAHFLDILEEIGVKLQFLGEQHNDPRFLGISQINLANACFLRFNMETGMALIQKALKNLALTDDRMVMIQALLRLGRFQWWQNDYDEVIITGEKVLGIGKTIDPETPGLESHIFNAHHSIGMALYSKGQASAALQYAQKTFYNYFHILDIFDRMRMFHMLAFANLIAGNYEQSKAFIEQGLKISRLIDNDFTIEVLLTALIECEVIQGQFDSAYAHAAEVLKICETTNHTFSIVNVNSLIGDIFSVLQDYGNAIQYYRIAQVRAGYSDISPYTIRNDLHLARALSLLGQVPEARDLVEKAISLSSKYGMKQLYIKSLSISGLCNTLERNFDSSEQHYKKIRTITEEAGLIYEFIWAKVGQSRIALSKHQFSEADETIRQVIEESKRINAVWPMLHGLQLCAELHKALKDTPVKDYAIMFQNLMNELEANTQTPVLAQAFSQAKQLWSQGHHYP